MFDCILKEVHWFWNNIDCITATERKKWSNNVFLHFYKSVQLSVSLVKYLVNHCMNLTEMLRN